ncbi:MAG TPA: GtrA family protein [Nitrolancea sp.]|jgi:putative flippase GtrA|nr:GtrA family protein [Nitrolancea sp.]
MIRTIRARHFERAHRLLDRPARFVLVGLTCSAVQLGSLAALIHLGLRHDPANIVALVFSTQVNFLLSSLIIWPDRPVTGRRLRTYTQRIIAFNGMSLATMLINEGVFAVADHFVPYLIAGVCGIAVAAPINFLVGHYLIFRTHKGDHTDGQRPLRLHRLPGVQ